MVDVLFATNRPLDNPGNALAPFGSGAPGGPLYCGVATVDQIDISAPSSGRITAITGLVQGNFTPQQFSPILGSGNDVLVFIHGCANDFTDSITRAAYNRTWLANSGLANSTFDVISFSWPACAYVIANIPGDYFDYRADQDAATASAAQFTAFLNQMAALRSEMDQLGTRRMNLLCHSMGNFMLGGALPAFLKASNTVQPIFDEIVLAAADEPADTFSTANHGRLADLGRLGREITIYYNNDDVAMDLSHLVNKTYRLGYDGPPNESDTGFFSPAVFEFVDSTGVNDYISSWLEAPDRSHQYYRQSPTVRQDIVESLAGFTPTRPKYDPTTNAYYLFPGATVG